MLVTRSPIMRCGACLALALLCYRVVLPAQSSSAARPRSTVSLAPCDGPSGPGSGRCGTLEVFEDRANRAGRSIPLNILVVPALSSSTQPPVFWFEGGPGGAATQSAGPVSQQYLKDLRADRDLVFVDQRGTGKSNPLKCGDIGETPSNLDGYFGPLFPITAIRACRDALASVADLTKYTTSLAMDDIDDVRAALGYDTIDLAGASYGTLSALVYARQHPAHAHAAFLIGIVPPDFRLPLPFAKASDNALARLVDDCAADPVCHAAFPDVRRDFDAVLARFTNGALSVAMTDPATQRPRTVALARESYVEHLRALLYTTTGARWVPLIVHAAAAGNFVPFQTMALRFNLGGPATSRGMYFSVTCAESIPFISEAETVAETRGTFLGDRRLRSHIAACAEWPKAAVPAGFLAPIRVDMPIVYFSGDADGSTPPWLATTAVQGLSNGRQIIAPHTGHQIDGPCTWNVMAAFFRNPSPKSLNASCVQQAQRPAFPTALPTVAATSSSRPADAPDPR